MTNMLDNGTFHGKKAVFAFVASTPTVLMELVGATDS
jgi:hypothetical protein